VAAPVDNSIPAAVWVFMVAFDQTLASGSSVPATLIFSANLNGMAQPTFIQSNPLGINCVVQHDTARARVVAVHSTVDYVAGHGN